MGIIWSSFISEEMVQGWPDSLKEILIQELNDQVAAIFWDLENSFSE